MVRNVESLIVKPHLRSARSDLCVHPPYLFYRLALKNIVSASAGLCVCVCVCVCQASIAYQRLSHQLTAATIVEIVEAVPTRVSCAGIDSAGGAVDCKDVPAFSFDEASGSWF